LLVAIAGWPSLPSFIYQIGQLEFDVGTATNGDEGAILDRVFAVLGTNILLKAYTGPLTSEDVRYMQTIACALMAWWGSATSPSRSTQFPDSCGISADTRSSRTIFGR
jgi:hypothetical protein